MTDWLWKIGMNGLKTEYANGDEEYAEGFVDYHKGTKGEQSRMEEDADYNG